MKASETHLLKFLRKSEQFAVPIYQRTYSWTEAECRQLWDDIIRTGSNNNIRAHFLGSIVYIEKGLYSVTGYSPMLIIDGQQRLTTVSLLIEALARHLENSDEVIDGFSTKKLRNYYLLNSEETDERRYKLILSKTDKETYLSIISQSPLPNETSRRITKNFEIFEELVVKQSKDLSVLCMGLEKLAIVDISLNKEHDNPQLIFESMNSTGRELSQADLIRNFVLMDQELEQQEYLYNHYWYPMETSFGKEPYVEGFDDFMRHYLTVKNGVKPRIKKIYDVFKDLRYETNWEIEELLQDLHKFCQYYWKMTLRQELNQKLADALFDLQQLKSNVTYPLLFELYDDYENNLLTLEDFVTAIRIIESYVLRRAICDIPTPSMSRTFASFARKINKDHYLESFKAEFLLLQTHRRFPRDQEFTNHLKEKDIYNFQRCKYLLRQLENYGRKEPVSVNEYSIEHIMPQNYNLPPEWRKELGEDWERIHSELLHTLGNLTLTGYNSEYSDRPFTQKRDIEGGFRQSPLFLNRELGTLDEWNEKTIQERANLLSDRAVEVWPIPVLPDEILNKYISVKKTPGPRFANYTIDDHKHLMDGATMHSLFSRLSQEIQEIDPTVVEDFRKYYAAYKVEGTNFASIEGFANSLRVDLCMPFAEIYDPRKMAKQIPPEYGLGRSEARVKIREFDEIPYVMGLIRQAFQHLIEDED